jgi:hypothetical protein
MYNNYYFDHDYGDDDDDDDDELRNEQLETVYIRLYLQDQFIPFCFLSSHIIAVLHHHDTVLLHSSSFQNTLST